MVKKAKVEEAADTSKENAAPARESKGKPASGGSKVGGLFRFTLTTVLVCGIAVLLGAFAIQKYVLDAEEKAHGDRLAQVYAQQFSGYYNQIFTQASRQLGGIVATGNLAELLTSGDDARISTEAAAIAASLANKSQVFLIANASAVAGIPLGFAAQDMAERAFRGEAVNAEIIPLKEQPLLLLAYSVRDAANQVVGVLLVGFDLNEVSTNLKVFEASAGLMTLRQSFADTAEPQAVMSYGNASLAASPYVTEAATLHPNLKVQFALNPQIVAAQTGMTFMIVVGVMLLLVFASIVLTNLLLRRALRRNGSMLLQYAESLLKRAPIPVGIQFDVDVFDDIAQSLNRTARGGGAEQPANGGGAARRVARADVLDVDISAEDSSLLGGGGDHGTHGAAAAPAISIAPEIFRAYDIRGVVGKSLTDDTMRLLGQAIGSEALDRRQQAIYVGRDGRLSGPQLLEALIQGITSTGCRVVNLGMVPTPLVYFAAATTGIKSGVMLTGSHNPPDYNGLKIVIDGETLADQRIQGLRQRIEKREFRSGNGSAESLDIAPKYLERVRDDIVLARPMKIVVDCGNGVAGAIAPQLLSGIGCQVIPLFCDVDGHFPNHHPDPSKPENLNDLVAKVLSEKADIGLAFDGDGDRIGVVTPQGNVIWPDRLMMLYAKDLLMRSPGADIIFDVKCTRDLASVISQNGGRPVMWRTGHSLIKAKLKETGAALAGEMSGHIFFNDRWYGFDDALYSAARLLEILSLEVAGADEVFAEFPINVSTPELNINVSEDAKFRIVEALQKQGNFGNGSVSTIDGVRVDYPEAWGLVRASNTSPVLVARFEGRTAEDLETVRTLFREQLLKVEPSLRIPF